MFFFGVDEHVSLLQLHTQKRGRMAGIHRTVTLVNVNCKAEVTRLRTQHVIFSSHAAPYSVLSLCR